MELASLASELWRIADARQSLRHWQAGANQSLSVEGVVLQPRSLRAPVRGEDGSLPQDVIIHLAWAPDFTPQPGDRVDTSDGRRWTVLTCQLVAASSRWVLYARDLVLTHGLNRHVTVEMLSVRKQSDGTLARGWHVWKTGLRARVALWKAQRAGSARTGYERRYRITLEECPPLDCYLRLRTPAGKVLEVLSVHAAERVDQLPWVEAIETCDR